MTKRYRDTGFRVPRKTRAVCEQISNSLRQWVIQEYGWNTVPFPAVALVEEWGSVAGPRSDKPGFDTLADKELPGAAGEYRPHEKLLVYSDTTWARASDGHPEDIENVTHEICHYILGHPPIAHGRHYANDPYNRLLAEEDSERQVEWATDELLMPSDQIQRNTGYGDIMNTFGVTDTAAVRRIQHLTKKKKGAS